MFGTYFRGKNPIIRLFLNKKGDILKFALLLFHSFNLEVDVSYCSILSASSIRPIVPTYDVLVKFNYLHLALVFFDDICSDDKVLDLKVEEKKQVWRVEGKTREREKVR